MAFGSVIDAPADPSQPGDYAGDTQTFDPTDPTAGDYNDQYLTNYFQNWLTSNDVPFWGTGSDPIQYYRNARTNGLSQADALQQALTDMGWTQQNVDIYHAAQQAPPPGGTGSPGPSGGGAPPPTGSTSVGSLTAPFSEVFTPPPMVDLGGPAGIPYIPPTPQFTPPTYTPPPAFSYADFQAPGPFVAPTGTEVTGDPGYQFRLGEGERALEQSAAARGVINSGGTLGDLVRFGQQFASNEYGNVYNRRMNEYNTNYNNALQNYQTNRQNALSNYNTNYQTQYTDPYQYAYRAASDEFAPQMEAYRTQAQAGEQQTQLDYQNAWNRYMQDYNSFRNWQNDVWNRQFGAAQLQ